MSRSARTTAALAAGAALCLSACSPPSPPRPAAPATPPSDFGARAFSGARALEDVRLLVEPGLRDSGTEGARHAAEHLAARAAEAGLTARIDAFTNATPRGAVVFRNVLADLPAAGGAASRGLLLFAAHYDTKSGMPSGFQGANDSGSGCGALLEIGRVLAAVATRAADVRLAFLDGEECMSDYGPSDGLHGSRRLAGLLAQSGESRRVLAVFVLDMVGDRDLNVRIPRNTSPELVRTVFRAAHDLGYRNAFGLADTAIVDDHVPFLEAGMPAVNAIDFQYGSRPGANDYWHTAHDTLDKLGAESLATVGRVVLRAAELVTDAAAPPAAAGPGAGR